MNKMNGKINNIMKDCAWLRGVLYFTIAALPVVVVDLTKYKSFSEISGIAATVLVTNMVLQGLIAVRAYIDQTISRVQNKDEKNKEVELLVETTK
jgi:hypothetical protein